MAYSVAGMLRRDGVGADDSFGPELQDHFDFTLRFEHIFMSILPSALFVLIAPVLVFRYFKRPTYTDWDVLLGGKLVGVCFVHQLPYSTKTVL